MLSLQTGETFPLSEVTWQAVRSQGAGGQNVNKVATAVHLRFDILASSLPENIKQRLLRLSDKRISKDGIIVIKSQAHRTQEANRQAALQRLIDLINRVTFHPKKRIATRPTKSSQRKRLNQKRQRSDLKKTRQAIRHDD